MYIEVVGALLASLGGASVIIAAFAHFLGKVWTDRIGKSTSAKFDAELEVIKSSNTLALEEFKAMSSLVLKEKENYAGISLEFYQSFFQERVRVYLQLLDIKNEYISDMEEEFLTEIHEAWGDIYHSTYKSIRKLLIEKQLYISNDLDELFGRFRKSASQYIRDADMVEAFSNGEDEPPWENEKLKNIYTNFARETSKDMNAIMEQVGIDVSKLRSRIDIDKT